MVSIPLKNVLEVGAIDLDALRIEIMSNRARSTVHGYARRTQRIVAWDAIRASIVRSFEVVELYPAKGKVLLLSWMPDKRPLHTVWAWDGYSPPELVPVYYPDEEPYKTRWTNGYRRRL